MKSEQTIKRLLDLAMAILLPLLMAEALTGQQAHEWLGLAMVLCFLAHHILNGRWIWGLPKGSYSPVRCLLVAVNLLLFADMLALAVSGMRMSGFVFAWLPVGGGMLLARRLHLFASYWGLLLMSAHLGLHVTALQRVCRKMLSAERDSAARSWILRILAVGVSGYGVYGAVSQRIASYLFLQTPFVVLDETKPAILFFLETTAIIVLFAAAFHYLYKLLAKIKCSDRTKKRLKPAAFLLPLLICVAAAASMMTGSAGTPF